MIASNNMCLVGWLLLLTLTVGSSAHAEGIVGLWSHEDGSTYVIIPPLDDGFLVAKRSQDGSTSVWEGHWVKGMEGTQFAYASTVATINRTGNVIKCEYTENEEAKSFTLKLIDPLDDPLLTSGTWQSSWGATLIVTPEHKGAFDIVVKHSKADPGPNAWSGCGYTWVPSTENADWRTTASNHGSELGSVFRYLCPPNGDPWSPTYGTDIYSADSPICIAAVHAGQITLAEGGTVLIVMRAGQDSYAGSTRNGVETYGWGAYTASYQFVSATPALDLYKGAWIEGMEGTQFEVLHPYLGETMHSVVTIGNQEPPVARCKFKGNDNIATWTLLTPWPGKASNEAIDGTWVGPGGDTIVILNVDDVLDVTYILENGRVQFKPEAKWTEGLVGTQFEIRVRRSLLICTFNPQKPDELAVRLETGEVHTFLRE